MQIVNLGVKTGFSSPVQDKCISRPRGHRRYVRLTTVTTSLPTTPTPPTYSPQRFSKAHICHTSLRLKPSTLRAPPCTPLTLSCTSQDFLLPHLHRALSHDVIRHAPVRPHRLHQPSRTPRHGLSKKQRHLDHESSSSVTGINPPNPLADRPWAPPLRAEKQHLHVHMHTNVHCAWRIILGRGGTQVEKNDAILLFPLQIPHRQVSFER
ncbi:hypothetical protein BS50DRAFT_409888 [Corynespora cassiicola Philippines]|uniref:Uncharacterized protein n=1 Tax=Corynespora cassiicola Philippines TaxID=1448308 RepID=A0A2T2NLA7_CORCC|nr:hypothetical protein BS50DRAFT_409888 [Corynespora cassiicola Philippines]